MAIVGDDGHIAHLPPAMPMVFLVMAIDRHIDGLAPASSPWQTYARLDDLLWTGNRAWRDCAVRQGLNAIHECGGAAARSCNGRRKVMHVQDAVGQDAARGGEIGEQRMAFGFVGDTGFGLQATERRSGCRLSPV